MSCYAGITSTHELTTATALLERADGTAISFIFAGEGKATAVVSSMVLQTDLGNAAILMTSNTAQIMRTPPRRRRAPVARSLVPRALHGAGSGRGSSTRNGSRPRVPPLSAAT